MGARFDETAQAVVIAMLSEGKSRAVAAQRAGTTPATIRALIRAGLDGGGSPQPGTFAESVEIAEALQPGDVEEKLLEAAKRGEPWAVQLYLKGHARETYGDKPAVTNVNVGNTINVEGTADERRAAITQLGGELDARIALTQGEG